MVAAPTRIDPDWPQLKISREGTATNPTQLLLLGGCHWGTDWKLAGTVAVAAGNTLPARQAKNAAVIGRFPSIGVRN